MTMREYGKVQNYQRCRGLPFTFLRMRNIAPVPLGRTTSSLDLKPTALKHRKI